MFTCAVQCTVEKLSSKCRDQYLIVGGQGRPRSSRRSIFQNVYCRFESGARHCIFYRARSDRQLELSAGKKTKKPKSVSEIRHTTYHAADHIISAQHRFTDRSDDTAASSARSCTCIQYRTPLATSSVTKLEAP